MRLFLVSFIATLILSSSLTISQGIGDSCGAGLVKIVKVNENNEIPLTSCVTPDIAERFSELGWRIVIPSSSVFSIEGVDQEANTSTQNPSEIVEGVAEKIEGTGEEANDIVDLKKTIEGEATEEVFEKVEEIEEELDQAVKEIEQVTDQAIGQVIGPAIEEIRKGDVSGPESEFEVEITYDNPTVNGYGLDNCREWGDNCGLPAATAFCKSKNHEEALYFSLIKENQKTRTIGSDHICDELQCDRISQVICKTNSITFQNPKVNGYDLDRCTEWGDNCGLPAALAFCESKGYSKVAHFKLTQENQKTQTIITNEICDELSCDRISQVTCEK